MDQEVERSLLNEKHLKASVEEKKEEVKRNGSSNGEFSATLREDGMEMMFLGREDMGAKGSLEYPKMTDIKKRWKVFLSLIFMEKEK